MNAPLVSNAKKGHENGQFLRRFSRHVVIDESKVVGKNWDEQNCEHDFATRRHANPQGVGGGRRGRAGKVDAARL